MKRQRCSDPSGLKFSCCLEESLKDAGLELKAKDVTMDKFTMTQWDIVILEADTRIKSDGTEKYTYLNNKLDKR